MSGTNYLGRAGAYAMHKRYPTGSQTPEQLRAERANLIKAREARGLYRHTRSAYYKGLARPSQIARASAGAGRTFRQLYLNPLKYRTLGVRYVRYRSRMRLPRLRITGITRRFRRNVGVSRYLGRTAWGSARRPTFHKRIGKRQRRFHAQSRWKYRGKRFTPR